MTQFDFDNILDFLQVHHPWLWKIYYFDSLSSTNDYLMYNYKGKLKEAILVLSNYQSQGKGQFKRVWLAKKNQSILLSLLLETPLNKNILDINSIMADAVLKSLKEDFSLSAYMKKPNDIFVRNKKLAGILSEIFKINANSRWLVLGLGMNIHQKETDFPISIQEKASSLALETDKKLNRLFILSSILGNFEKYYKQWKNL